MTDYTLADFNMLRACHPTWQSLREHLTGEEGGKLQVRSAGADSPLAIIHYNRSTSDFSVPYVRFFRSVIWNMETNMPVAVSTVRAEQETEEGGNVLEWSADAIRGCHMSEYLDGVTLTLFKDGGSGSGSGSGSSTVQISSRTRFGATAGFYNRTTFNQMLADAVAAAGHASVEAFFEKAVAGTPHTFLNVLVKHPEHRVVEKVDAAQVYILQAGHVDESGSVHIQQGWTGAHAPPALTGPAEGVSVATWFEELVNGRTWAWQGVVVEKEGRRWRIKSSVYRMIRSMRGNTSRSDERFFGLRAVGMVKTYLQYYPEESGAFWGYEKWLRAATKQLYSYYVGIYKARELKLEDVATQWHTHIQALSRLYVTVLKPAKKSVLMSTVIEYMNALPVPRLLFLMNFERRSAAAAANP